MKNKSSAGHVRGFTLLEAMIAMAIFSMAVAMAATAFSRVGHAAAASAACGRMHQNMRHSLDVMTRDLHAAKRVITVHDQYYFGVVLDRGAGDEYVYYLAHNGKLYRFTLQGSEVLAENIDSLGVQLRGLDGAVVTTAGNAYLVQVRLTSEAVAKGKTYSDDVETLVRLRNKQV